MRHLAAVIGILVVGAGAVWADDGAALYEKKCKVYHSIKGVGGAKAELGGKLDGVGSKRDEAWLKAYFADPKAKVPKSKMPKMKLPDAEWDALVKYMLTLK